MKSHEGGVIQLEQPLHMCMSVHVSPKLHLVLKSIGISLYYVHCLATWAKHLSPLYKTPDHESIDGLKFGPPS